MDELNGVTDASRPATIKDLLKGAVIAGVAGGIVSGLPLLSYVNCCCFLGAIATGAAALALGLKAEPGVPHLTLTPATALSAGAIAGALSGALGAIISFVFNLLTALFFADLLRDFYRSALPYELRHNEVFKTFTSGTVAGAFVNLGMGLTVGVIASAIFGALGSFAMAQFKFKDRLQ